MNIADIEISILSLQRDVRELRARLGSEGLGSSDPSVLAYVERLEQERDEWMRRAAEADASVIISRMMQACDALVMSGIITRDAADRLMTMMEDS